MFLDAVPLKYLRFFQCKDDIESYYLWFHAYIWCYNILMVLSFKTQLKLNNIQRTLLTKHAGTARHAYNWGLALSKSILNHNKAKPEEKIKFPTAIDLHKWLVARREA